MFFYHLLTIKNAPGCDYSHPRAVPCSMQENCNPTQEALNDKLPDATTTTGYRIFNSISYMGILYRCTTNILSTAKNFTFSFLCVGRYLF